MTSYGLLLGAMTAHAVESSDPRIRSGGAAFLVSDATILLREPALKGRPAAQAVAGILVMTTYAAAQRLLVDGLLETDRGPGVQCMAYYVSVLTVPVLL